MQMSLINSCFLKESYEPLSSLSCSISLCEMMVGQVHEICINHSAVIAGYRVGKETCIYLFFLANMTCNLTKLSIFVSLRKNLVNN